MRAHEYTQKAKQIEPDVLIGPLFPNGMKNWTWDNNGLYMNDEDRTREHTSPYVGSMIFGGGSLYTAQTQPSQSAKEILLSPYFQKNLNKTDRDGDGKINLGIFNNPLQAAWVTQRFRYSEDHDELVEQYYRDIISGEWKPNSESPWPVLADEIPSHFEHPAIDTQEYLDDIGAWDRPEQKEVRKAEIDKLRAERDKQDQLKFNIAIATKRNFEKAKEAIIANMVKRFSDLVKKKKIQGIKTIRIEELSREIWEMMGDDYFVTQDKHVWSDSNTWRNEELKDIFLSKL